jgi:hypothetical protein
MDEPARTCNSDPTHVGPQITSCTVAGFTCTLTLELDYSLARCLRGQSVVEIAFGSWTPPGAPASPARHVAPPQAGKPPFPDCPVAGVIGSRGSGEKPGSPQWKLGLGPPSYAFTIALGQGLPDVEYTANPAPGYPAASATTVVTDRQKYIDSVRSGERQLLQMISAEAAACPTTNIILTGYSQGAELTGDAYLAALHKKTLARRIWGVILFGDPLYNHADPGVGLSTQQRDLTQNGILTDHAGYYVGPPHTYPKPADYRVLSFCVSNDPACQGVGGTSPTNGSPGLYTAGSITNQAALYFTQH